MCYVIKVATNSSNIRRKTDSSSLLYERNDWEEEDYVIKLGQNLVERVTRFLTDVVDDF